MKKRLISAKPSDRIVLALDNMQSYDDFKKLAEQLAGQIGWFKVGFETLLRFGAENAIAVGKHNGIRVFADAKLKDIPKTMELASKVLVDAGASMFNIHASNTVEAIQSAAHAKGDALLLGVTILTSYDERQCAEVYGATPRFKTLHFASRVCEHGADGVVCSSQELVALNENPSTADIIKVVPGIQPLYMSANDQRRVMTPFDAIKAGADLLVIGRAITDAHKYPNVGTPAYAAEVISQEIEHALMEV